jgi:hypothetical protein
MEMVDYGIDDIFIDMIDNEMSVLKSDSPDLDYTINKKSPRIVSFDFKHPDTSNSCLEISIGFSSSNKPLCQHGGKHFKYQRGVVSLSANKYFSSEFSSTI